METALSLSLLPQLRLKSFVDNIGSFQWDNPDRAETLIKNLCGPLTREADLLILAVRAGIPATLRQARNSGFDLSPEASVVSAAARMSEDYAIPSADARWAAETVAVGMGMIPLSAEAKAAAPPPPPAILPFASRPPQRHEAPPGYSYQPQQPPMPNVLPASSPPSAYAPPNGGDAPPAGGAWPPAAAGGYAGSVNDSGQKAGVPAEIASFRWNWGAFGLSWIWCLNHGLVLMGIGVLVASFIPVVNLLALIYLGLNGHKLGWWNRRFEGGVDQFITVERAWMKWGIALFVLGVIGGIALFAFQMYVRAHMASAGVMPTFPAGMPQGAISPGMPPMPQHMLPMPQHMPPGMPHPFPMPPPHHP